MPRLRLVEDHAPAPAAPEAPGRPRPRDAEAQADLVRRVVSGEPLATRRLFNDLGPSMLRVIRAVLGVGAPDAEDVLQESLMAVLDALPSFRLESGLRHFACRIAVRKAVRSRQKAASSAARHHEHARGQAALQPSPAGPGQLAAAERRRAELRRLLDEIPEAQAEALTLRVVLGCSLTEIAAASAVPVNTVRSRIRLAKEALRRRIESDPEVAELFEVEP